MVRYCTNPDCRRYDRPLPRDAGPCPDCGTAELRIDVDIHLHVCSACGTANAGATGDCWSCGASLDDQVRKL